MAIDSTHEGLYRTLVEIIDTMNCGLIGRDMEGVITFVNDRFLDWLGYDREELEGQAAALLVPPELRELTHNEMHATDAGDVRARLTVMRRKDSTTFPVLLIPQRLFDRKGKQLGSAAIIVDMGAVQTAKHAGYSDEEHVRAKLNRIVMELQSITLASDLSSAVPVSVHHPVLKELSAREKEILAQLVAGERVSGIAKLLHISPHTVRNHLKSIFSKLDVHSQSELIHYVRSLGAPSA